MKVRIGLAALVAFVALGISLTEAYSAEKATFAVGKTKAKSWATSATSALKNAKGVSNVKADVKARQVQVTYDPQKTNLNALATALTKAGTTPQLLLSVGGLH